MPKVVKKLYNIPGKMYRILLEKCVHQKRYRNNRTKTQEQVRIIVLKNLKSMAPSIALEKRSE